MDFKLISDFTPTGDQPEAISQLVEGIKNGDKAQTLLGVTGSGKTFTIANVINKVNKPTLILSHNKTLAAQLYEEFKHFFPENAVEYYISFYDYYQPEAYLPVYDKYIEKDFAINDEIEAYRMSAVSKLISGRKDIIVVASVSAIFGAGNPKRFKNGTFTIKTGEKIDRNTFLKKLVNSQYIRNDSETTRGEFRVVGDNVEVHLPFTSETVRISFWDDEIDLIEKIDEQGKRLEKIEEFVFFPSKMFVIQESEKEEIIQEIIKEKDEQVKLFLSQGKKEEAKRIDSRVMFDIEMIRELGYCKGIENYSRHFDKREPGTHPCCLLDYFPEDFLMIIDESHAMIPQLRAMTSGVLQAKKNLVEYGFRLPSVYDNRPLLFNEFEDYIKQVIFVSATPGDYELEMSNGVIVDQVIRPTGLLDPEIEVRKSEFQIDDLMEEIVKRIEMNERTLVTTLTIAMAEELSDYLSKNGIKCMYLHSKVDPFDRIRIMNDLRSGKIDVIVGVNLLREGLDLPEVSLVAILDADKEGFLRNGRSLTQTVGRAARNIHGKAILYADIMTKSMQYTIDETNRRREKQKKYNEVNGITPQQVKKSISTSELSSKHRQKNRERLYEKETIDIESIKRENLEKLSNQEIESLIREYREKMKNHAKNLEFLEAAFYRDEIIKLESLKKLMFDNK